MNHLGLYSSYNSCTGVSLSSHRLSSLKVGVRNEFLTPTYSHRLHSLLLLLWTKWFFRPACIKKVRWCLVFWIAYFLFLWATYLEILSRGDGNEVVRASYGVKMNDVLLNVVWLAEGTWNSIIAVIGDGAKSELAGVRKIFLLPLWVLEVRDFGSNRCPITAIMKKSHVP